MIDIREHGGIFGGDASFKEGQPEYKQRIFSYDEIVTLTNAHSSDLAMGKRYLMPVQGNAMTEKQQIYDLTTSELSTTPGTFSDVQEVFIHVDKQTGVEKGIICTTSRVYIVNLETKATEYTLNESIWTTAGYQSQTNKQNNQNSEGRFVAYSLYNSKLCVIDVKTGEFIISPVLVNSVNSGKFDCVILPNNKVMVFSRTAENKLVIQIINVNTALVESTITVPTSQLTVNSDLLANRYSISTLDENGKVILAFKTYNIDYVVLKIHPDTLVVENETIISNRGKVIGLLELEDYFKIIFDDNKSCILDKNTLELKLELLNSPPMDAGVDSSYSDGQFTYFNGEYRAWRDYSASKIKVSKKILKKI